MPSRTTSQQGKQWNQLPGSRRWEREPEMGAGALAGRPSGAAAPGTCPSEVLWQVAPELVSAQWHRLQEPRRGEGTVQALFSRRSIVKRLCALSSLKKTQMFGLRRHLTTGGRAKLLPGKAAKASLLKWCCQICGAWMIYLVNTLTYSRSCVMGSDVGWVISVRFYAKIVTRSQRQH